MQKESFTILKNIPIFKGLKESDYEQIFSKGKILNYPKNTTLLHQGENVDRILFILDGKVKVSQIGEDGNQVLLRVLGHGQPLAAVTVLENDLSPATAFSLEPTKVFALKKDQFLDCMSKHASISLKITQLLLKRISELQQRLREMATECVEKRIARTLIRFVKSHGKESKEGVLIDFPLTRQDLAEFTGTTLFTVSRLLKNWEKEKILKSGRKKVILLNLEKLKLFF